MAETNNQNTVDELRAELNKLSSQIESIVKNVESRKNDVASELVDKLTRELDNIRSRASYQAHKLYDASQSGMDEVGEQVRRNPLTSLLVAFGAGCVISCLFRHLR